LQYDRGNGNVTELAPLSEHTFTMLNIPNAITVTFVTEDGQQRMRVTEEETVLGTLEKYTPAIASDIYLKSYLGAYTSDEISTTYTIIETEGKLVATHPRSSDIALTPLKADIFKAGGNTIEFTRDGNNTIQGLKVSTGRVRNLKFTKD